MRTFVTINKSEFPIVVFEYNSFVPTLEEFLEAQQQVYHFISDHINFVQFIDFSEMPLLPYEFRICQMKWQMNNRSLFVRQGMKVVVLAPKLPTRIMMKSLFVLMKPGIPCTVVSTREKGFAWAKKQLTTNAAVSGK